MADLTALTQEALTEVAACGDLAALDAVRVRWLGKKGVLTEQLKSLGALPAAERPAAGARINAAKERVQAAIEARHVQLERADIERELAAEDLKEAMRQTAAAADPGADLRRAVAPINESLTTAPTATPATPPSTTPAPGALAADGSHEQR